MRVSARIGLACLTVLLLFSQTSPSGASEAPLYSGFLGRVLHLAETEADVTFVRQMAIDEVSIDGTRYPAAAWLVEAGEELSVAFVLHHSSSTITGIIEQIELTETGQFDARAATLSSWSIDGDSPDGPVTDSMIDVPIGSMAAAGPGCELAGTLVGGGVSYKVPQCTTSLWGALACALVGYIVVDGLCDNSPGSWADGATCTSRGIRWNTTEADPQGIGPCAYELTRSSNYLMVRAIELIPTNCKNPASQDCYGINAGGQLVKKGTNWRLTTHWPNGVLQQNEYFSTIYTAPKGVVTYRTGNLPRGTYRMVVRAEETIDFVGWSETGKIQSLWSVN